MGAWKKQSVPLVFIEIARDSIIKANADKIEDMADVLAKIESEIDGCWSHLRGTVGAVPDKSALRITSGAAERIAKALLSQVWAGGRGVQCIGELTSAMMVIAEDCLKQLPVRKFPQRVTSWRNLTDALDELRVITGTVEVSAECEEIAAKLADIVRAEADL